MSLLQKISIRPFANLFTTTIKTTAPITRFTLAQRYYSDKGKALASQPFEDFGDDEVEFTKPIEEVLPEGPTKGSSLSTSQKGLQREPVPEPYLAHRAAMKRKFPEGWNPPKKLSRQLMDDMRALRRLDPEKFTTDVLASQFRVSPEAVRRILRSRWTPDEKRGEEYQERDEEKRAQTLEYYKQLREKRKAAREKARKRNESGSFGGSASSWKQSRYGHKGGHRSGSRVEEDGFTLVRTLSRSEPI
ncbi:Required for respiratory growth protein 9 mitochondrial [Tulasnella sp. 424]|nr:Required for respiratory growth protein 9 mitochondrial [Tulasnella sp. 424]KAG8974248.1 Required for respiratory growth protein 9 mitochondrial [Tulasnella sp. 425]